MQLIALASAAALLAGSASAGNLNLKNANAKYNANSAAARVHNTCSYKVYLWSVCGNKDGPCSADEAIELNPGDSYKENWRNDPQNPDVGPSIKISKTTSCAKEEVDITQLEYFISSKDNLNYFDVSFVDCQKHGGTCPGRDRFCLKSGENGKFERTADNKRCPILDCKDKDSCSKVAYLQPNDVQTKSCESASNIDFYICGENGSEEGGNNQEASSAPASTPKLSSVPAYSAPASSAPASSAPASSAPASSAPAYSAAVSPVVTAAAVKPEATAANNALTKTEVVYVTQVVEGRDAHIKRHAHGHKHFHA